MIFFGEISSKTMDFLKKNYQNKMESFWLLNKKE